MIYKIFTTALCLIVAAAAFLPATTGCSGGAGVAADANLAASQKGTVYYIDDHLGSAQMLADGEGAVVYEGLTAPFGIDLDGTAAAEAAAEDGGVDYSYTTKERDEETGLVYFGKRYYGPEMGRWLTPDPLFTEVPSAAQQKPLSSNLYAYVRNNPANYVDPDGFVDSAEFYLNRQSYGAQYAQNIVQGPWSPAEATFQRTVGFGVITMAVAPIALPLAAALAPIAGEAFLAGSIKAYGVRMAASTAAVAEAGYLWNAGRDAVISAAQSIDVPRAVMTVNAVRDFAWGYSVPDPPSNKMEVFGSVMNYGMTVYDYWNLEYDSSNNQRNVSSQNEFVPGEGCDE
jgi:RHS repeat-associated protein